MKYILVMLMFLISSCADKTRFEMRVDSIKSPDYISASSVYIKPGTLYRAGSLKSISKSDLEYKKYKKYLENALKIKGYFISDNLDNSDSILVFDYGISEPINNQGSEPVWGQTGYSGSSYSSNCSYGYCSGSQNYTPTYGVTGYRSYTYTTYARVIRMTLYKNEDNKTLESNILWKTETQSTGSSDDLKYVIPHLIAGSLNYMGEDLEEKKSITIYKDSDLVKQVKGININ